MKEDRRLDLVIWLLKLSGIWARDGFDSKWKSILYNCYTVFIYFAALLNFVLMSLYVILSAKDVEDVAQSLNICITQTVIAVKVYPFIFRRKKVIEIIKGLADNYTIHGSNHTYPQVPLVKKTLTNATNLIFIFYGLINVTTLLMIITPLTIELTSDETQTNSTERALMWLMWYPFDVANTNYYIIAFVQQAVCCSIESISVVSLPGLFYFLLIFYVTAQFDLLSVSLRNTREQVLIRLKEKGCRTDHWNDGLGCIPLETSNFTTENTDSNSTSLQVINGEPWNNFKLEDIDDEMFLYLKECVRHHQALLEYVTELNSLLSPIFFWEFATGALVICMVGFHLMAVPRNSILFVKIVLHLISISSMMAFTSWFGSNLISQSEDVHNAAYECGWYDGSPRVKHLLRMIILRAQRPAAVTAGYFGSLSLPFFATVVQTSYSYLAVLRQMKEE